MSAPDRWFPVNVLPLPASTMAENDWNCEMKSGPQPSYVHTPPETVLPVTCPTALRRTQMPTCSAGSTGVPAVTVLSLSVTRDGDRPSGPTTMIPADWKVSTTTWLTRPLAVV